MGKYVAHKGDMGSVYKAYVRKYKGRTSPNSLSRMCGKAILKWILKKHVEKF